MTTLRQRIADPAVLVSLAPEELASQLLKTLQTRIQQSGMFHRADIGHLAADYPDQRQGEVEIAIMEAWRWLEFNLFILPAPAPNGQNGWFVLGRRGKAALAQPAVVNQAGDLIQVLCYKDEGVGDPIARVRLGGKPSPSVEWLGDS